MRKLLRLWRGVVLWREVLRRLAKNDFADEVTEGRLLAILVRFDGNVNRLRQCGEFRLL